MPEYEKLSTVFVICGRNFAAFEEISKFLASLRLKVLDWDDAAELVGTSRPASLETIQVGMKAAGAAIVIFTPDEVAAPIPALVNSDEASVPKYCPMADVLVKFGMAYAIDSERTIAVKLGRIPRFSEIKGIDCVTLTNDSNSRQYLAHCLTRLGLRINVTGVDYLNTDSAGDFEKVSGPDSSGHHVPVDLQLVEQDDIFYGGIDYLKAGNHGDVCIYAPTGAWHPSHAKYEWFEAIAECLRNTDENKSPKLGNLNAVYGLPSLSEVPTAQERAQFPADLDRMEDLFKPFESLSRAHLYYIDPTKRNVPGTGTIIVDNTLLALAWAIGGRSVVDYGFVLCEPENVITNINKWFNHHVMGIVKEAHNVIQDVYGGKTLGDGMDDIRGKYGLPRKHRLF